MTLSRKHALVWLNCALVFLVTALYPTRSSAFNDCTRLPSPLYDPPTDGHWDLKYVLPSHIESCRKVTFNPPAFCSEHPAYCDHSANNNFMVGYYDQQIDPAIENSCNELPEGKCIKTQDAIAASGEIGWRSVSGGERHLCGIRHDGTMWCRGYLDQLGSGNFVQDSSFIKRDNYYNFEAYCMLTRKGRTQCWSEYDHNCHEKNRQHGWRYDNNDAELTGEFYSDEPVQEASRSADWLQLSASGDITCAIRNDGTLWCFGDMGWRPDKDDENKYGNANLDTPTQEPTKANDWQQVSVSHFWGASICALKTDNTMWCWGDNTHPQLATPNNDSPFITEATQEPTRSNDWFRVSMGISFGCGLKIDGSVWCWGSDDSGSLVMGNRSFVRDDGEFISQYYKNGFVNNSVPVREDSHSKDWIEITAGNHHACGLKRNGTIWCWGRSNEGQLGIGQGTTYELNGNTYALGPYFSAIPVQEATKSNEWKSVSAGSYDTCAVKKDGTLWCWGWNPYGNTGDPHERMYILTPTQEASGRKDWLQAIPFKSYEPSGTCAITKDYELFCWGKNSHGQLGRPEINPESSK